MPSNKQGVQHPSPLWTASRKASTSTQESMSVSDVDSFTFSFELGVEVLMEDQPCSKESRGAFRRLCNSVVCTRDLLGFIACCSDFRDGLVRSGRWTATASKQSGRWAKGLRYAIEHALPANSIVHPSPIFDRVVTFLGWLKRLPVCIRDRRESITAYYRCEERLASIDFGANVYVPMLRQIWQTWFRDFEITSPLLVKHGSGSTADAGRERSRKWDALGTDPTVRICMKYPNLEPMVELPDRPFSRVSKVQFVPKQAGKDRTICMEPATLMYLQQGLLQQLSQWMQRHPVIRKYTRLDDQSINQGLCARAYADGLATIDLSDASDSVSWQLVSALTKGTRLYRYLLGTKSTHYSIDGVVSRFVKFAPMGSAMCFPIETLVFISVVHLAYQLHFGKTGEGQLSGCAVYGDDIICPAEIYDLVLDILYSLGFLINESKSSLGPYFESCGVEYLYGVRINSIKHPRSHLICHQVVSPEQVGLVTDLANSLYAFGSWTARRTFLQYYCGKVVVVDNRTYRVPELLRFSDEGITPICDPYVTTSWHPDYQRRGVWGRGLVARHAASKNDYEEYSHSCWLASHAPEDTDVVHPRFSDKGVSILRRMGHHDLLRRGDVEVVGSRRAGRLVYGVKKRFYPR